MGRPYDAEIERLPATFEWSVSVPNEALERLVEALRHRPLYVVGSGGSLSVATAAAWLHEAFAGAGARAITPLDAIRTRRTWRDSGALLISAGGSNSDICAAALELQKAEPRVLAALTGRLGSPLAKIVSRRLGAIVVTYSAPGGKDGYVATNSLLASVVLLARAYGSPSVARGSCLPADLATLMGRPLSKVAADVGRRTEDIWARPTVLALHGAASAPAAIDFESKCSETGLVNVLLADFRHFAHGRHLWLARRAADSAVIAFATPEDAALARRTLEILPRSVPRHTVELRHDGAAGLIEGIIHTLIMVQAAGRCLGVDPGRPHVPSFGRKLYRLGGLRQARAASRARKLPDERMPAPVARKMAAAGDADHLDARQGWDAHHANALQHLRTACYRALVLDYDGTLCSEEDRHRGLSPGIGTHLRRLVRSGLTLGIATGRGDSAWDALHQELPRSALGQVIVGYYNGAVCLPLSSSPSGLGDGEADPNLSRIAEEMDACSWLKDRAEIRTRQRQIRLSPRHGQTVDRLWRDVTQLVASRGAMPLEVLRSDHSVDVLASGVKKTNVIDAIARQLRSEPIAATLRIGDHGQWPGNDYLLLDSCDGLSVWDVSAHPRHCWNLTPSGVIGIEATTYYLSRLHAARGCARLVGL